MDFKNVLIAIILSTIVLVVWGTLFEQPIEKNIVAEKNITEQQTAKNNNEVSSPSVESSKVSDDISRNEAISKTKRVKIENNNIEGSISLEGAIIDDIIFKNYKENLKSDEKVIFLNPKNSKEGYYIETGWAPGIGQNLKLPTDSTIWTVKGNSKLTPNTPIFLEWNNNEGLIFTKKIELDDKFLFKITQGIKNTSNKSFVLPPYAQITRNYKTDVTPIYILHEVFIGIFDEELREEDYEDVEEQKFSTNSEKGWLGITDK